MDRRLFAALALAGLPACSGKDSDGDSPAVYSFSDCDPIAPTLCGLPFPSTFYMREDSSSATGWRVHLGETTLPENSNYVAPTSTYWNELDGWSPLSPLLAELPGLSSQGLLSHLDLGAYTGDDVTSVIVDLDTGERIAHFAELDMSHDDDDRRLLLLRPVVPMQYGHRYAVGLRGLVDTAGAAIEPSPAFLALRDDSAPPDGVSPDDVEGRRDLYEDRIFPALADAGFARSDLQLAWDFVVGSREKITGRAVAIRDDLLDKIGPDGPAYEITEVEELTEEENANTARRVYGRMTVPLYTDKDGPGSVLTRDADGMPYQNGETTVPFTVIIPRTLIDDPRPARVVQYGHGLLGDQDEVKAGYLAEVANRYGWIFFAVDWTGMKTEDALAITYLIANDLGLFAEVPERSMQGFAEFVAAMRLITGPLAEDLALQAPSPDTRDYVKLVDPDLRNYYGNSQGGILGGAYLALAPDVERGVLGVTGMPYSLLLDRSADFEPFFDMFRAMYPDPRHVMLWLGLIQSLWDSGEPSGYAEVVTSDPLPGAPAKQVLLQVAIGDKQVSTLGAEVMARAYGARLIDPPVREVWGLETAESGYAGSALVEWDYGLSYPTENLPPSGDDPHEWPRREADAQEQMRLFFETGEVVNTCDGACFSSHE